MSDQIDEEENPTKAEELSHKVNKLEEKLGPEYLALVGGLKDIDPNSQDAQEIGSILEERSTDSAEISKPVPKAGMANRIG